MSPLKRLWCTCMPEPLSWKIGFGMNVATSPLAAAVFFMMYLYVRTVSRHLGQVPKRMSISD